MNPSGGVSVTWSRAFATRLEVSIPEGQLLTIGLPQHPDQHGPEDSVLLAVDQ